MSLSVFKCLKVFLSVFKCREAREKGFVRGGTKVPIVNNPAGQEVPTLSRSEINQDWMWKGSDFSYGTKTEVRSLVRYLMRILH